MAINQQTLASAKSYTDEQINTHEAQNNPHPQYAQLLTSAGTPTGGELIVLTATEPMPAVVPGSVMFAPPFGIVPMGIYLVNETGTAWVLIGNGPLPADLTAPTVPGNLATASKTSTSLTVSWSASTDTETGVGGYDVSIDSGPWVSLGNVLTYTFSGLAASSSHTMRVRARDNATTPNLSAAAPWSDTTSAVAVTVPRNLRTTATATTSITFAWDAPTSGTVARYEWRLPSPGSTFATNGTSTTKQVTGLTADTPYTFGVRAVGTDGSFSAEVPLTARTDAVVTPGTGTMYIGVHLASPPVTQLRADVYPELQTYVGMSQRQVWDAKEAEFRSAAGLTDSPVMTQGHIYQTGGYTIKAWGTTQLGLMPSLIANYKPAGGDNTTAMQRTASGAEDSAIIAAIQAMPTGKRIYMVYGHEPQETGGAYADAWRAASVKWAQLILANRGARDIHPMICQTTWSFRANNASIQAQFNSVVNDYTAAGIDWRTQVVNGPDGYQTRASAANYDASTTFETVYPPLYAIGWRRFGLTETGTSSHTGTATGVGGGTITSADVTGGPQWVRSLVRYAQSYNFEYINWFHTVTDAAAQGDPGSWQYTTAIKRVWAEAAHYKGPAPSWPTP